MYKPIALCTSLVLCLVVSHTMGDQTYYVSPTGNDGWSGGTGDPFKTISRGLSLAQAGDTVMVMDGTYDLGSGYLQTYRNGSAISPITLTAQNSGQVTVTSSGGRTLSVSHSYLTVHGMTFDGQFGPSDVVRVRSGGDNLIFSSNEVMNGARDGIDMGGLITGALIENTVIHDMLWHDGVDRLDAHGIVTDGAVDLIIRNTQIYYVSGDSFQAIYGGWDNILIDGCDFWNGPLPTARAGFPQGVNPGENAIDTKKDVDQTRGLLTIRNSSFHGWRGDYISNAAALNLKTKVDTVVEGNELYDNTIALRLRGRTGDNGAHVTVINNVLRDNSLSIRYEDDIQELLVLNNTFDEGQVVGENVITSPDYPPVTSGFYNNLFISTNKPVEAINPTNLGLTAAGFVDAAGHDYHLLDASPAIDAGTDLTAMGVLTDADGMGRPQRAGFDVGAYEAAIAGDADGDGDVDGSDLATIGLHWAPAATDRTWADGDFDYDGDVDGTDLAAVGLNWSPAGAPVPEPVTITLLGISAVALLGRRRR